MNMKISTILHDAADYYLAYNRDDYDDISNGCIKDRFSCCAVSEAIYNGAFKGSRRNDSILALDELYYAITQGLKEMGCPIDQGDAFKRFGEECIGGFTSGKIDPHIQGMRYFWLKWAALMAEEQEAANV